jgi:ABC-type nitrate/sulfonate/bicarbonate transport system substrate-binding protein
MPQFNRRTFLSLGIPAILAVTTFGLVTCNRPQVVDNNTTAPITALEKVKILLDWKAEPTYAGFYIAKEKGYFKQVGLDVEIVEGNGATTSTQVIGSTDTYLLGSCSGSATAIARSKGIPVKSLAVFYPNIPTVLYSLAENPILKPNDMIGKRIGLINGSITVDEYRGVVAANKIDRSKIKEVGVGFDVAPLLTKKVDGLMNYQELTPVELRLQGHNITVMKFADYGVHAYSLNLIASEKQLGQKSKQIKLATDAIIKGYIFLKEHPMEAAEIFSKVVPEKEKKYVAESTKVVAQLLGDRTIGEQTPNGWTDTIKTLDGLRLLPNKVTANEVATYIRP